MGRILDMLRSADHITASLGYVTDPSNYPIATPWGSSGNLQRLVFEDVFGTEPPLNTRNSAMQIPAIARGRNRLVSTICRFPLVAMRGLDSTPGPAWLHATNTALTPQHRMAWTVDDLIFSGWSMWFRPNPDDPEGPCGRVNMGDWQINDDNRVEVYGSPVSDEQVILFPGLHEGILSFGSTTLQDARSLYAVVRQRLLNPVPQLNLHQTTDAPMTDPEIDALIARWAKARQGLNGGVGYTNHAIEVQELGGGGDAQLMIAARNAASVDLARVIGVTASVIDATADKASLTYETTTGRNQEFVDVDLALYMTPIAARLSLDDVVPPGERVAFDMSDYTAPDALPTGPTTED